MNPSASVGPIQNYKRLINTRNMGRNKFMVAFTSKYRTPWPNG
jgi:hypothetical protein